MSEWGTYFLPPDLYQKKIRLIAAEISALDNAINVKYKEIDDQRASLGGVHAASQNNDAIQKQIRVLENRLDKVRLWILSYEKY